MNTLVEALEELHDQYVVSVNLAVESGDLARATELAARYEDDAIVLMAQREGLTHLLPLKRRTTDSRLRTLVNRFRHITAA
jgi:hypothetical protein